MPRGVKAEFSEAISDYLAEHARQDSVLARVEQDMVGNPRASMQVSPDQGALLTVLVRAVGARNALEIGTFTGYSAICIARGLEAGGRLTCLEIDEGYAATARANLDEAGVGDRVTIRLGPAEESLERMPEEPAFDFVFLDADKQGYADYYELILPRMRPGALMLIDNTLLGGRVLEPEEERSQIVAELNDKIAADERVDSAMAFIADGVTFVRKR
jgi:caffeoyl-CoA O-methyltransferase